MTQKTLVLGAGMVGVGIAWHLLERGREVILLDRREPGHETSYGNAGLIQRDAVRPHPFPRQLAEILRVIPNQRTDIRYSTAAMFKEISPLWQYWNNSAAAPYAEIVKAYASLIVHCTDDHQRLIEATGAESLIRRHGWLEIFRTQKAFDQELAQACADRKDFGVTFEKLDAAALHAMEPYISDAAIGAIHWTCSWAVTDPGGLVSTYASEFEKRGGTIMQATATQLSQQESGWKVTTDAGDVEADELVLATGPWSTGWLKKLNYNLPMFVQRGYHMHYAAQGDAQLNHGIMDFEKGYLITPKKAGLRLTTGAELNEQDAAPRYGQLDDAEKIARDFFPLGERREGKPWHGSRPCLPDMKPVISPASRHQNLWFAFGHGHQGFTLGPTTGRLLTQMMDGETPAVDMAPFHIDRFQ